MTDLERVLHQARDLVADHPPMQTAVEDFLGAQFDRGLARVHFDVGHGGLGLPPSLQQGVDDEQAAASAPSAHGRIRSVTAWRHRPCTTGARQNSGGGS